MPNTDSANGKLLTLINQVFSYGLGILGRQLAVYLILPILIRNLEKKEYAVIALLASLLALLNQLTNAGLPSALYRFYHNAVDQDAKRQVLGTFQSLITLFAFVPSIFIIFSASRVSELLFDTRDHVREVELVGVLLVVDTVINYGIQVLRLQFRPLATSLHSILTVLIQISLALLFIYQFEQGTVGYWSGWLLGAVLGMLVILVMIRSSLSLAFSSIYARDFLSFGLPLLPAVLSRWMLNLSDRLLIQHFIGLEQVATYDVGYKIGSLILFIVAPFNAAWPAFAFSITERPFAREVYRNTLTILVNVLLFFAFAAILFRREALLLFASDDYLDAYAIIPWIVIGQCLWGTYSILSLGPQIVNQTSRLAWAVGIAALINLAMNVLLIPQVGIIGSAWATLVGYAVLIVITYVTSEQIFPLKLDISALAKAILLFLGLLFISDKLYGELWQSSMLERLLILMLFPIGVLVLNFFQLSHLISSYRSRLKT